MTHLPPARARPRPIRIHKVRVAGLLAVIAASAAAVGYGVLASSPSPPTAAAPTLRSERPGALPRADGAVRDGATVSGRVGRLGEADGAIPDGTTVFDGEVPGVGRLDDDLLGALRRAAVDAADDGLELYVNSGWRSPRYQEHLLHEAVSKYGSEEEAARWVATPTTSAHVSGDAVDIGRDDAARWLGEHGATYGLCRVYRNEPWHYELRPDAGVQGCPPVYADPTQDPRMR